MLGNRTRVLYTFGSICVARQRGTRDVQKLRTSVAEHGRLVAASSGLELSLRYLFEHKDVEGLVGN